MIDGKSVDAKTEFQKRIVRRFSDIQLCRIFHWTPDQITDLPSDFYEDTVLILNKEATKQKIESERQQRSAK